MSDWNKLFLGFLAYIVGELVVSAARGWLNLKF